jgi:hypothetical protein
MIGVRYRHGHSYTMDGKASPEYRSWQAMKSRCTNPATRNYASYGGAGIAICARWYDFVNFLDDMGPRPLGTSLDRYPNPWGDYEPGNCRWATPSEQQRNRRDNVPPSEPPPSEREQAIREIWPDSQPWPPGSEGERWFERLSANKFWRQHRRRHGGVSLQA